MSYDTLLVIVGAERGENPAPFIVGAFNEEYLNQLPLEDAEIQIARLKETWTGEAQAYYWREVLVRVPLLELVELFEIPEIDGELDKTGAPKP